MVKSCIYTGVVRHRRFLPVAHAFRYRFSLLLLDIEQLEALFNGNRWWSATRVAPAWFRRADFHGDASRPLAECVRDRVQQETGQRPQGTIFLLANPRYFGVLMNPITCYYCYAADDETLQAVVAEVTNTPWNERHAYVIPVAPGSDELVGRFAKALHVSPFHPMAMHYHWRGSAPGERLTIHIENRNGDDTIFDATLRLQREALTHDALNRLLWRFPLLSLQVAVAIYWQAFQLFLKRVPLHPHPASPSTHKETLR